MDHLIDLLPDAYAKRLSTQGLSGVEELRLHTGQPLTVRYADREERIWPKIQQGQLEQVLLSACKQSVYAYAETLRNGYVTLEGGHRIGICGFGVVRAGEVQTIRSVSSLVIRIAGQVIGCAAELLPHITNSALIFGPPCCGKTTLLRDLVRLLSDVGGQRISLVDERCELSAGIFGVPQLQIGARTDVMVNVPKAEAAIMMLRTMNPQWIAMDEITLAEDVGAMEQIAYCGVNILATAHGKEIDDLMKRPLYRRMMEQKIFKSVILLNKDKSFSVREL